MKSIFRHPSRIALQIRPGLKSERETVLEHFNARAQKGTILSAKRLFTAQGFAGRYVTWLNDGKFIGYREPFCS
jgi:hypothetical protein